MESKSGNYKKYTSINPLMRWAVTNFVDCAVSMATSVNARTILDAGCGEGFVLSRLGDRYSIGMDISRSALKKARQTSPEARIAYGDLCNMPFKSDSFDLVMALEVLEHIKEPIIALAEANKVSRRYCLFSVPREPYFRTMDMLRGKNICRLGNDPEHLHNWTEKDFIKLISEQYDVIEVRKPFPWTMALCEKKRYH